MMFTEELILVEYGEDTIDKDGNRSHVEIRTPILCSPQMVNRSEFYQARQNDLSIDATVMIHPFEYCGQKRADFRGKRMSIIRVTEVENEGVAYLEVHLGEKLGERS